MEDNQTVRRWEVRARVGEDHQTSRCSDNNRCVACRPATPSTSVGDAACSAQRPGRTGPHLPEPAWQPRSRPIRATPATHREVPAFLFPGRQGHREAGAVEAAPRQAKLENTRAIKMDVSYLPQNGLLSLLLSLRHSHPNHHRPSHCSLSLSKTGHASSIALQLP